MSNALNLAFVWRQMEDVLFPALRLSTHERALYVHLLRHSRLEGRRTVRVSRNDLARAIGLCASTSRHYLRALARKQVVRFLDRSALGCLLEILLPDEVTAALAHSPASRELTCAVREVERDSAGQPRAWPRTDHFRSPRFRARILKRDSGQCFYCLRPLRPGEWTLDHVNQVSRGGSDSASNVVASCVPCNWDKGQLSAEDFIRSMRRKKVLTPKQMRSRLRRLRSL